MSRLFHVNHIKGDVVADALSRTDINAVTTVDLQEIAKHQAAETTPRTDMPSLEIIVPLPFSHGNILVDVSTGVHRPLVPENLRHKVFLSLHSPSHPGARATSKLVRQRFMWPHMDKEHGAENVSPVRKARFYSPSSFPLPKCRLQHIHMDLVGPLPSSNGHTHILTVPVVLS